MERSLGIIIPTYRPNRNLIKLIQALSLMTFKFILIVNYGSSREHDQIFNELKTYKCLHILNHSSILGKGHALKMGFRYVLKKFRNLRGIITVDSDGQHSPNDVLRLASYFSQNNQALCLGSRLFSAKTPLKSRLENWMAKKIFFILSGLILEDTKTGLRAIPISSLEILTRLRSGGNEFELDMLIKVSEIGIAIKELSIETPYNVGSMNSHFNPLIDSFKFLFLFMRTISTGPKRIKPMRKTNWDVYYDHPNLVATLTRATTTQYLLHAIERFLPLPFNPRIIEIGGADSCFFSSIANKLNPVSYVIIDNNLNGIQRFQKKLSFKNMVEFHHADILTPLPECNHADIVFSVGVIEHFPTYDSQLVIASHFKLAKANSLVIITFPTPTISYFISRKILEILGLWIFHDERPIPISEVEEEVRKYGDVLYKTINRKIPLTQGIVVARHIIGSNKTASTGFRSRGTPESPCVPMEQKSSNPL